MAIREVLTPRECERVLRMVGAFSPCEVQEASREAVGPGRTSTGASLPHGPGTDWLFSRIHPVVEAINHRLGFEVMGYSPLQVLRYELGQQYDWHVDMGRDERSTRKLSLVVQLTDGDAYDGGDLEWMPDLGACPRGRGALIAFPSFVPHRVTEVTRGMRQSLVAWVHGENPFR